MTAEQAPPWEVEASVRAWTGGYTPPRPGRVFLPSAYALVLDTETGIDAAQHLTFGCWQFYDTTDPDKWICLQEGLFYADDLAGRDPEGLAILDHYARTRRPNVDANRYDAQNNLHLLSRSQFVEHILYRAIVKAHATVIGFNLPFDVSRLAMTAGAARKLEPGAFTLSLWRHTDAQGREAHNRYRPAIIVRHLTRHASIIRLGTQEDPDDDDRGPLTNDRDKSGKRKREWFGGHFLDAHTLAFALTNTTYSLDRAAKDFHLANQKSTVDAHGTITPDYVDYNRQDVTVTAELTQTLLAEHARHPITLLPTKAFSPASIAKAYLRAMGVQPVLARQPDFDPIVLGYAMSTFFGGRSEGVLRRTRIPVALVDFTSMYPTVDTLMSMWDLLTANRIDTIDATEQVQALLDNVTVESCFDPTTWTQLVGIVQIHPDGRDILPVRAPFGGAPTATIGIHPLSSPVPLWYSIPDLVASTLLSDRPPRVLQAIRFVPAGGKQPGLRAVKLRGEIDVDPATQDFFATVVEQRQRIKARAPGHPDACGCDDCRLSAFLKVLANSGSYGIYAELNPHRKAGGELTTVPVHGHDDTARTARVAAPEKPGEFCFPPIATTITGAARLMLALLERCVTDVSGSWAFCDTDSMAIIATETSSLVPCPDGPDRLPDGTPAIRALSLTQVDEVRQRFASLNPYNRTAVPGTILKCDPTTDIGDCFDISAKRYSLIHECDGSPDPDPMPDDDPDATD